VRVGLRYGRGRLEVELPEGQTDVIRPRSTVPAADSSQLLRQALRRCVAGPPLRERWRRGQSVAISICDHTRPQPHRAMVEAVLDELPGVPDADVTVLVATGTHRASTPAELRRMLGPDLLGRVRAVNHDCHDTDHVELGTVAADVPVALDRRWVEADVRITTGFVEPHFFAGFSGGPKLVAPGLAALRTVKALHNAERIGSPRALWGVLDGNPVHEAIRAAAALAPPTLSFDVLLDREHEMSHAFAGDLDATHAAACRAARQVAMHPVPHRYPVVVASNAGFPLDQNLYQAVKGMRSAAQVVAPGGLIVCVAECCEGVPTPSSFADQIRSGEHPRELLERIRNRAEPVPDQWQVQVLAEMLLRHRIAVHCAGIPDAELREAGLIPVPDVAEAVTVALRAAGPGARVCVLPEGPETIPYVEEAG
jgi:lactate racemase